MRQMLKEHWIRFVYGLVVLILAISAYGFRRVVLDSKSNLDAISYFGTVATLIGLVVAIAEVLHGIRATSSLRAQVKRSIRDLQAPDRAFGLSECLAALDDTNDYISREQYHLALKCFQFFRKTYRRVRSLGSSQFDSADFMNKIAEVETILQKCTHASSPLDRKKRALLTESILEVKGAVESIWVSGREHAAV